MWGSGLRAAAAISRLAPGVRLLTAVDQGSATAARIVAKAYEVDLTLVERDEPVSFSYFTPLSSPSIGGRTATLRAAVHETDGAALIFGMVETGDIAIDATHIVFDPQRPRELTDIPLDGLKSKRLAVIVNRAEATAVSGQADPSEAARVIAQRHNAEVVVVKRAAQGAIVFTDGLATEVGPFRTPNVFPIGSGDVFAAGFTWAWAVKGMPPIDAARVGSLAAATWCSGETLPLPLTVGNLRTDWTEIKPRPVQVYLAAPFFTLGELWLVEQCREAIVAMGARVFSPLHEVGRTAPDIAAKDLKGLAESDSVMALLDGADPGTWFEVGWARKTGKPVVAYCDPRHDQDLKMAVGSEVDVVRDLSSAVYRAIWAGQL